MAGGRGQERGTLQENTKAMASFKSTLLGQSEGSSVSPKAVCAYVAKISYQVRICPPFIPNRQGQLIQLNGARDRTLVNTNGTILHWQRKGLNDQRALWQQQILGFCNYMDVQ